MNRAYSIVWNDKQQAYVPAPETARRSGRKTDCPVTLVAAAVATLFACGAAQALDPGALPAGGVVTAGQASIGQSGSSLTIRQTSSKVAIDWQRFGIGQEARVDFVQPSANAIALNRVVGQEASQILGSLQANGQVFVLNPHGILFGRGAQVSAAGVLASTRALGNDDFMAGKLSLRGSSTGTVVNEGAITVAPGGYAVLVGAQVRNAGSIVAPQGDVRLAAANQVSLQIAGSGLAALSVDQGTLDALAENGGLIKADGGRIFLTADALDRLARATVNNTGVIEAHTVDQVNGTIVLKGDLQHGSALIGGTLDASAPNGGDGGLIETSAAHLQVAPTLRVSTQSARGQTGTWLIDPVDFTIAASGGDITGAQLSSNLGSSNVTIQSSGGTQGTAGDIHVNDVVSWSANTLTLSAHGGINVNANLNGSGTASLALEYGQGAPASGNLSAYVLARDVKVTLPSGNHLSTRLGSDGVVKNFHVITTLGAEGSSTTTDLQGMRAGLTGNYALGADIDASATSTWQSGQGFTFIGTQGNVFSGNFEGLGHTIDGLSENWAVGYVGLFGKIDTTARVGNVHLTHVDIRGGLDNVGGLVGHASRGSVIEHVSVQGSIRGGNNNVGGLVGLNDGRVDDAHADAVSVTGRNFATGGLIGKQTSSGTTTRSDSSGAVAGFSDVGGLIGSSASALVGLHSSATVMPTGGASGGLVGRASSSISNSYATGNIASVNGDMIGGLVGQADGTITDSHATGNVRGGGGYTGGLVGKSNASITNSYATGTVDGAHLVGGLAGFQRFGTSVSNSYATGNVSGTLYSVGGLIGSMGGSVIDSYATGNVSSRTDAVGGLIGSWSSGDNPEVRGSHASGTVQGRYAVGGLIGDTGGCFCSITNSHASGAVTGTADYVGGLIGYVDLASITDSHATGAVQGINNVGGLAGQGVNITHSQATGQVSGASNVGGLVGLEKMGGTITGASHASGQVTGTVESAGGLVGRSEGTVQGGSYSTSRVVGVAAVGGLIGGNYGSVSDARTGQDGMPGSAVSGTTRTGGLIGHNSGTVSTVLATGDVTGSGDRTGGLIGFNEVGGTVSAASASGTVRGLDQVGGLIGALNGGTVVEATAGGAVSGNNQVGGLIGSITAGSVTRSTAAGAVDGASEVGGFVGRNAGTLLGSLNAASGNATRSRVSATSGQVGGFAGSNSGTLSQVLGDNDVVVGGAVQDVGGIVGVNSGTVRASQAVGLVQADQADHVGGLVGRNASAGVITQSYATSRVSGRDATGGLVGLNEGRLSVAYAAGSATGRDNVGGLIGQQASAGSADNVYAAAGASGRDQVGGLIGDSDGSVGHAYASGTVTGSGANAGGLLGRRTAGTVSDSVFDLEGTGQAHSSGDFAATGEVASGRTSEQMKAAATFSGWDLSTTGSHDRTWRLYEGSALPLLTHWLTPLTISGTVGSPETHVYDGTVHTIPVTGISYTETLPTGHLLGSAPEVSGRNVGTYGRTSGFYSDQQGYDLTAPGGGSLTITPAVLTATATATSRPYDGTTAVQLAAGGIMLSGFVAGEGATSRAKSGTFDSRHVATASTVNYGVLSAADFIGLSGTLLGNYSLPGAALTGGGTITPRPLTVTATALDRIYDGSTAAQVTLASSGIVSGDDLRLGGSGRFADRNAGSAKSVSITELSKSGADAGNYSLPAGPVGATASILARVIGVTATAADKVYDGSTRAQIALTASNLVEGDQIQLSGEGRFADKNAGTGKTVRIGEIRIGGPEAGNYVHDGGDLLSSATIVARVLGVTASAADKVYDGSVNAQISLSTSNLVEGDRLQLSGTGRFADRHVGNGKTVQVGAVQASGQDAGNYVYDASGLVATAAITARPLTVVLQGTASKAVDATTAATMGPENYRVGNLVDGESISISQPQGEYADARVGSAKPVTVMLTDGNYRAGPDTLLSDYALVAGRVTGAVGVIVPGPATNVDSNNEGRLFWNVGGISLPQAFNGVLTTLPASAPAADAGSPGLTVSESGRTQVTRGGPQDSSPLAPAAPSAVSANTRDNLLSRRAFSIDDGGIRLPQGVRGADKDASQ